MSLSPIRLAVPFLVLLLLLLLDLCVLSHSTPARDAHAHHHDHHHEAVKMMKLPEELAEEEEMRLCGFGPCLHHDHGSNSSLSGFALWVNALGCSVSVSLASLVCLILLPVMFVQGKPAKGFVDALALFGAGAMLGDAFLHQLPHAFGGGHSHDHDDHHGHHDHDHDHSNSPSHSHSIQDLSVGLPVLARIVVFLLVEKLVRYVEENSSGSNTWGGHHHHHHAGSSKKLKDEDDHNNADEQCPSENSSEKLSKDKSLRKVRKPALPHLKQISAMMVT